MNISGAVEPDNTSASMGARKYSVSSTGHMRRRGGVGGIGGVGCVKGAGVAAGALDAAIGYRSIECAYPSLSGFLVVRRLQHTACRTPQTIPQRQPHADLPEGMRVDHIERLVVERTQRGIEPLRHLRQII